MKISHWICSSRPDMAPLSRNRVKCISPVYSLSIRMPRMQADGVCKDITLGACKWKIQPFYTNRIRSLYGCQKKCKNWKRISKVVQSVCTFFSYHHSQKKCKLFEFDIRDHDASCEIIGGPPSPDLEKCVRCSVSVIFRYSKH